MTDHGKIIDLRLVRYTFDPPTAMVMAMSSSLAPASAAMGDRLPGLVDAQSEVGSAVAEAAERAALTGECAFSEPISQFSSSGIVTAEKGMRVGASQSKSTINRSSR
jgi:hypothetical protein